MADQVEFETPENVLVTYRPAGLGSRFIALFLDYIVLFVLLVVLSLLVLAIMAATTAGVAYLEKTFGGLQRRQAYEVPGYFIGLCFLLWGLGGLLYFGLSEYLMRGQTLGKRAVSLRVVKLNGFALDAPSIFLRNVFRIIENPFLPPLWLVPLFSKSSQRLGDMVAGTVLVSDEPAKMSGLRERLLRRLPVESVFRFDGAALAKARREDFEAVERILDRWPELKTDTRAALLESICGPLSKRLDMEPPEPALRLRFLEELLAAGYRREHRQLG
ncbi:MAG: RDD family protein [Planctomycetota bacterium]|nr:RDD family protein [Planctomycetota bacterium]